jgi:nitroreductase
MAQAVIDKVVEYSNSIKMENARHGFLNYTNYFSFFNDAPCVIAVVKKPYDSITQKLMRRYELDDSFMSSTDVQGPAAAIQNLLLMIHTLGYGACWMTGPLIAKTEIEKILNINTPDGLMALIPMGRASHNPPAPHRKEVKGIVEYL